MAYCTSTELTALTGTSLSSSVQDSIIAQADREIKAKLSLAGVSAPTSDDTLKSASLNLSIAGVLIRQMNDGTKPAQFKVGDISVSDNIQKAIEQHTNKAWDLVDMYIETHGSYEQYRWYIRKVNA